jgi:hypothetical protein
MVEGWMKPKISNFLDVYSDRLNTVATVINVIRRMHK